MIKSSAGNASVAGFKKNSEERKRDRNNRDVSDVAR